MSATNTTQTPLPTYKPPQDVQLASAEVNMAGVNSGLQEFIARLGMLHASLFGKPLVITSGRDAVHGNGSKHYVGKAVDIRTHDKTDAQCIVLLTVLADVAPQLGIAVFDERALGTEAHIHIELAG
jgi:hypothetical protein